MWLDEPPGVVDEAVGKRRDTDGVAAGADRHALSSHARSQRIGRISAARQDFRAESVQRHRLSASRAASNAPGRPLPSSARIPIQVGIHYSRAYKLSRTSFNTVDAQDWRTWVHAMTETGKLGCFGGGSNVNSLTWAKTKRAYEEGQIAFRVDRALASRAAPRGLEVGPVGSLLGLVTVMALGAGIALGLFVTWWWFLAGGTFAAAVFGLSRQASIGTIRKAALLDERLFYALRDKKIIWFEKR